MKKKLPVYELKINLEEDAIVSAISLVEEPAIEIDFIAFSKQEFHQFNVNDDKMELIGAAMIPNQLIYRRDKKGNEFNVVFSKETIREIAQQYFNLGFQHQTNIEHSAIPAKSFIYQSYIVDETKGIKAPLGVDAPDGSWIVGMKVTDKKVWNLVKEGKIKGFSIEGIFEMLDKDKKVKSQDDEILELIQSINKIITKQ